MIVVVVKTAAVEVSLEVAAVAGERLVLVRTLTRTVSIHSLIVALRCVALLRSTDTPRNIQAACCAVGGLHFLRVRNNGG